MAPNIWSYYDENTVNCNNFYNEGFELGQHDLSEGQNYYAKDLVIIDWGQLWYQGGFGAMNWSNTFVPGANIENCTEQFAEGYYGGTGPNTVAHLRIALGTSNYATPTEFPSYAAGQAWGDFAVAAWTWIYDNGYSKQVDVAAGYDAELAWDSYSGTLSFEQGWNSATTGLIYDFGDAEGCPPSGSCANGWTVPDVVSVAFSGGTDNWPLPEIYDTNGANALQWANLASNGIDSGIQGVMTQSGACSQMRGCSGTNNTPTQGWSQLSADLGANSNLIFSSDICWFQNGFCS
ncbi:MAG: hypothetical protein ACRDFS_13750 [Chloroflexota bacterium]